MSIQGSRWRKQTSPSFMELPKQAGTSAGAKPHTFLPFLFAVYFSEQFCRHQSPF